MKYPLIKVEEAANLFLQSEYAAKDYPLDFYTKETLFCAKSRKHWANEDFKKLSMLSFIPGMYSHYVLSDGQFEREFIDCTLPSGLFNHEAHLRLAWININKYGIDQAEIKIQEGLRNFAAFVGAKDKYDTTLTIAAVNHFMKKSSEVNFTGFIATFPELRNDFKKLIESHYSFDVFNSQRAKTEFLEPDLTPFV